MKITLLPNAYVSLVWPEIEDFVKKSTSYSGERASAEDVKGDITSGKVMLWVAHDDNHVTHGFVTGKFLQYPRLNVLDLQFTGGVNLHEWAEDMWNAIEAFARQHNCDKIEGVGRLGWLRYMKRFGCVPAFYVYEKDLRNG